MNTDGMQPTSGLGRPVRWSDLQPYFAGGWANRSMVPIPQLNLVYVKNPKAGSSTLLVWLIRQFSGDLERQVSKPRGDGQLPTVADVGRPQVLKMLEGEAYRFSFVRDPVRRFESVYRDKLAPVRSRRTAAYRAMVQNTLGQPLDPEAAPTFEEFLYAVEQQDPIKEMDPHWRPQHVNLLHPFVGYNRIGRLESFDRDLELIRQEIGLPRVPSEVRNQKSGRRRTSVYEGRPDLVGRVERLYAKDMELYGY